jgi:chitinase
VPGDVETYTYTITATPTVATPSASLATGTYNNNQTVTLNCATAGAEIRYTTDGTDPTSSSQLYSGAISINGTTTLKAKGYLAGYNESSLLNNVYTLKVATPVATPSGGEVSSGSTVTLTNSTLLNTMRYTTNGPAPSCMGSGTIYTTPITINSATTLRVIGCKTNYSNSDILTAVYTIPVVLLDPPSATPVGGSFPGPVTVTLTLPKAPDLEIYYKLTDAEPIKDPPTNKDLPYKDPIKITTTKWLSAITYNPIDGTYSKDYLSERYMIIK